MGVVKSALLISLFLNLKRIETHIRLSKRSSHIDELSQRKDTRERFVLGSSLHWHHLRDVE